MRTVTLHTARLVLLVSVPLLAACSTDDGVDAEDLDPSSREPSIHFEANPPAITKGERAWLSWTAYGVGRCEASGAWHGAVPASGSYRTPPLHEDASFILSCRDGRGGSVARVDVAVADEEEGLPAPEVKLISAARTMAATATTLIQWQAEHAETCEARGGWQGSVATHGTRRVGPLQRDTTFELHCSGPGGIGVAMTAIVVQQATLRWAAPTDEDVAGFRIGWGTKPGKYAHQITVADPRARHQVIPLPGPGDYYFAMAAFDSDGREGARSNEAFKNIPR